LLLWRRNPVASNGNKSESYNGTSWTNTPNLNTARAEGAAAGTQTAAIVFAGRYIQVLQNQTATSESWNGSSWTATTIYYEYSKTRYSRLWNSNFCFRILVVHVNPGGASTSIFFRIL
jgi:hypothetical protein